MVKFMIAGALEGINRDKIRFVFSLGLSMLVHAIVFIGILSASFPRLENALPKTTKPTALTVYLKQISSEHQQPIEVKTSEIEETLTAEPATTEPEKKTAYQESDASGSRTISLLSAKYFSLAELDKIPETQHPLDTAPLDLLDYPQGGEVVLRLWVDEQGQVLKVEPIKSEMPLDFVEQATKLFMQAQFFPGTVNNAPVKFISKVVIHYQPLVSEDINKLRQ